jgi:uncharacterized protein involved in type VI secretion and phage assembly
MFNKQLDRTQSEQKFLGNYRGVVEADNDPYNSGRVRIRVFGVFDDILTENLPWAIMSDPFMGGISGWGGFIVPDVGSHVWVFFEAGDPTQPVYFAGAPAVPHGPPEATENGTYPRNKVIRTSVGHVIEIDDSEGANRIRVHHSSGTDVLIDDAGNVTYTCVGNVHRTIKGNLTEVVDGTVSRHSKGGTDETSDSEISINGSRVNIN